MLLFLMQINTEGDLKIIAVKMTDLRQCRKRNVFKNIITVKLTFFLVIIRVILRFTFADRLRSELESDGRLLLDPLDVPHPQRVPGQRRLHHRHRPRPEGRAPPRRRRHARHRLLPVGPVHPRLPGLCDMCSIFTT